VRRLIEQAKQRAVAFEQMLDGKMSALVRPMARPLEPLEIRHAVLREIEAQAIPGPQGVHVFPYNRVTITVRSASPAQQTAVDVAFDAIERVARQRLTERRIDTPRDLTVRVVHVESAPPEWIADEQYRVTFDRVTAAQPAAAETSAATLVLDVRGAHESIAYRLTQGRMDIGRTAEVRDRDGHLVRRNAVIVGDEYDPDGTVSRRHAHLKAASDADGRRVFIVFDDASRYGTRIVRDGETITVHPGSLGVRLRDGDELHLGDVVAAVRLEP
jgi:hypothetical protein